MDLTCDSRLKTASRSSHRVVRAVGLAAGLLSLLPSIVAAASTRSTARSSPASHSVVLEFPPSSPSFSPSAAFFAIQPRGTYRRCRDDHNERRSRVGVSSSHYSYSTTAVALFAKPKRGSVVDSYRTVSVNCSKCTHRLFRYKKKNGTKSNLVKCFVERIVWTGNGSDDGGGAEGSEEDVMKKGGEGEWFCPKCETKFARSAMIRGMPALKLVGGKIRMTKK